MRELNTGDIIRVILAIALIIADVALIVTDNEVPNELIALLSSIIMFYLGYGVNGVVSKNNGNTTTAG